MTHALKTWKLYYELQEQGKKLFELRKDDRDYKIGDIFLSQEFDNTMNEYTRRETAYRITYILRDAEIFGLKQGYCILQLSQIETF